MSCRVNSLLLEETQARRDRLMQDYSESVFIFPARTRQENPLGSYLPEVDANFFYLTGFNEQWEAFLLLIPDPKHRKSYRSVLFLLPSDPEKEIWTGERLRLEDALLFLGMDEVASISDLDSKLLNAFQNANRLFYRVGRFPDLDQKIFSVMEKYSQQKGRPAQGYFPIQDPEDALGAMRLRKSAYEIQMIQKACKITAMTHYQMMQEIQPGMHERTVEAYFNYILKKLGAESLAYPSIVAGGRNATCLHYQAHRSFLKDGECLLIDAGGKYQGYAADVTRTFPIGKTFTEPQARLYDRVLKIQKAAIAAVKPGVCLQYIHELVCRELVEELLSLGLLHGKNTSILENKEYRRYYPHLTSHWLGLQVHDAGLNSVTVLEPGMVFTIEPGFYAQSSDNHTPEPYRLLGIRIEDTILVTPNGCEVLTEYAPKERVEIENLRMVV